jgi:hypothetical protein
VAPGIAKKVTSISMRLCLLSVALPAFAMTAVGGDQQLAGPATSPKRVLPANPPLTKVPPINLPATNKNKYLFTLPDGASFEVLGVCESPSGGKTWWGPDGTPLSRSPKGAGFDHRHDKSDHESGSRGNLCSQCARLRPQKSTRAPSLPESEPTTSNPSRRWLGQYRSPSLPRCCGPALERTSF